jgi:glycosyltransferase involved in cell wall biosynthesis
MRIVHIVVGKVNPDTLNGVSKVVHWMATSQMQLGHDVEVWGLVDSAAPRSREYNLRQFLITRLRLTLGRELKAALDRLEPGTWVHFHSVFTPEYAAISRILRKRGLAYGITPHGGYSLRVFASNPLKKRIYFALREAEHLRGAALCHAVGTSEIEDMRRLAPKLRTIYIPNGQQFYPDHAAVAPPAGCGRPLIGYSGRLVLQQKGLDFLIDGFAAYKAAGGTGELWLLGDGEDRPRLERQAARRGLKPEICFLGARHGDQKLDMISGFDTFIHSSRWDGIPTACLEAAALGKPLLVSRETNLADYVERNGAGLVLDETSAAGVARALERAQQLYEENKLAEMGQRARSMIEKEFTWEENARRFIAAIQDSVDERSAHAT